MIIFGYESVYIVCVNPYGMSFNALKGYKKER